jgi:hypothetical protein
MDQHARRISPPRHRLRLGTVLIGLLAGVSLATLTPALAIEAPAVAQQGEMARLTVAVYDPFSEEMVPGAVIVFAGMIGRHVTDTDGRVVIDIPEGRYWVSVRRWGYDRLTGHLDVDHDGEVTLNMYETRDIDQEAPGTLVVRVVDGESGDPIEGALVSLEEGESRSSDENGLAKFSDLRYPVARFEVGLTGYGKRAAPVALSPARTTVARVEMVSETAAPRPVETEMRSLHMAGRGVHDHLNQWAKRTHVVTRPMLDQLAPAQLTDVFRKVPGIRIDKLASGSPHLYLGQCNARASLYLDGTGRRTTGPVQRRLFLDDIAPETVELIEIWERRRNRSCRGWVLIWTTRQGVG